MILRTKPIGRAVLSRYVHHSFNHVAVSGIVKRAFMQGFSNILDTVTFPSPTKEEAEKATQLWIDQIVVKHKLCPYAAKSNYEIIVVTDQEGDTHQARKEIIFQHMEQLESCTIPNSTKLLVFPHLETSPATLLYFEAVGHRRYQVGSAYDYDPVNSSMTIQAVLFRPPILLTDEMRQPMAAIQGNSPWNTIQLLKYSDLQQVWGYANTLGANIRTRNIEYIEKQRWTPKDEAQLIVDCYVKAREIGVKGKKGHDLSLKKKTNNSKKTTK